MSVTDEVGHSVTYQSDSVGTAPTANIVDPLGEVFSVGADILFTGSFTDAEDSMNDAAIFEPSRQVRLPLAYQTHKVYISFLPIRLVLDYTISVNVTDSTGLTGSDTVTIRVNTLQLHQW